MVARSAQQILVSLDQVRVVGCGNGVLQVPDIKLLNQRSGMERIKQRALPLLCQIAVQSSQFAVVEEPDSVVDHRISQAVVGKQCPHAIHVPLFGPGDAGKYRISPQLIKRQVDIPGQLLLFAHEHQVVDFRAVQWRCNHLSRGAESTLTRTLTAGMQRGCNQQRGN